MTQRADLIRSIEDLTTELSQWHPSCTKAGCSVPPKECPTVAVLEHGLFLLEKYRREGT